MTSKSKTQPKLNSTVKRTASKTPKVKGASSPADAKLSAPSGSKLDLIVGALRAKDGATLDALMAATQWQRHSVRGALAGALKKRGHVIVSDKVDGVRRYRIEASA